MSSLPPKEVIAGGFNPADDSGLGATLGLVREGGLEPKGFGLGIEEGYHQFFRAYIHPGVEEVFRWMSPFRNFGEKVEFYCSLARPNLLQWRALDTDCNHASGPRRERTRSFLAWWKDLTPWFKPKEAY